MRLLACCGAQSYKTTSDLWHKHAGDGSALCACGMMADMKSIQLQGYDVIYLDLHGSRRDPWLYADGERVLHVDTVLKARLDRTIVFATTCYMPETPFVEAFLLAGAEAVICGNGENFSGETKITGAARLFDYFAPVWDCPTEFALKVAKQRLRNDLWQRWRYRKATEDALQFRVWRTDAIQAV